MSAPGLPTDHFMKDGRSTYLLLTSLSIYSLLVISSISDTDLFGDTSRIELPFLDIELDASKFFWIAPAIIVVLNAFLHLVTISAARIVISESPPQSIRDLASRAPLYLRWAFCVSTADRTPPVQYFTSLVAILVLPTTCLALMWWCTHTMHLRELSAFLGLCLVSVPVVHLVSCHALRPKQSQNSSVLLLGAAAAGSISLLLTTFIDHARTQDSENVLFARADLDHGSMIARPEGYVPRFVWVAAYLKTNGVRNESPDRETLEDLWFDQRQYYLLENSILNLDDADLRRGDMNHAFLAGVYVREADLRQTVLTRADMESVDASGSDFRQADVSGGHLEQAYLRDANFAGARMSRVGLQESHLSCANFSDANLDSARLDGAFMDSARFHDADLEGASLVGAYAKRADFRGAAMAEADLRGAILWGADLSTAVGLSQDQLDEAIGDDDTQLPDGLTVRICADTIPLQTLPYRQQWWLRLDWVRDRLTCPWTADIALAPSPTCRFDR